MHMADALISPSVGGSLWAATAATTAYCSRKMRKEGNDRKVPLMGVLGAFIFAAQMVNFTIPAAGSSGHLGGGLILAVLLGPHAGFIVMASVLAVQALFFADGGLLSLGCNVFNLGFIPCFIAYPLIYKPIAGRSPTSARRSAASMAGAVVGLQLGALGVVLQTAFSGVSELPFSSFLLLMQPIHLLIGLVEGAATAAVVAFVAREEPGLVDAGETGRTNAPASKLLAVFALLALLLGGVFSWFASTNPDGLEWAVEKITGSTELAGRVSPLHEALAALQKRTALLPDYKFSDNSEEKPAENGESSSAGTGFAGIVGSLAVLLVVGLAGYLFRAKGSRNPG